jgi:hypothetical protein
MNKKFIILLILIFYIILILEQPYGSKCEDSTQCSHMLSGSQCENGVCGCANDYNYARGRCRKLSNLNGPCREVSRHS